VGGIVGGIEVDRDAPGPALEPPAMVLDDGLGQPVPHREHSRHPTAFSNRDSVGCEARAGPAIGSRSTRSLWIASSASRPRRCSRRSRRRSQRLAAEQLERLMLDLARLPLVLETRGQPLGQPEVGIDPLQQDRAAVGAGVLRVEGCDDGFPFGSKLNVTCAIQSVAIEPPSGGASKRPITAFIAHLRDSMGSLVSSFHA